jgi:hypothetical protein
MVDCALCPNVAFSFNKEFQKCVMACSRKPRRLAAWLGSWQASGGYGLSVADGGRESGPMSVAEGHGMASN